jgi:hypothetical protein
MGPNGCQIWTGAVHPKSGYPVIQTGSIVDGSRRPMTAHRALYIELNGPLEPDVDVHHTCHTRRCLNRLHLRALGKSEHAHYHHQQRRA